MHTYTLVTDMYIHTQTYAYTCTYTHTPTPHLHTFVDRNDVGVFVPWASHMVSHRYHLHTHFNT